MCIRDRSTDGVVIDKQLFARAKKDKFQKAQEKKLIDQLDDKHSVAINELKTLLIDKLSVLIKGQSSNGVKSIYGEVVINKGNKFTPKVLKTIDFSQIDYTGWTGDKHTDTLISRLLHNYSIKVNEEIGRYKRESFNISIGDELPPGVRCV